MIGGWNLGVENVSALAGISVEEYLAEPFAGVMRANLALDVDGMVPPIVPRPDEIRDAHLSQSDYSAVQPEALKEKADSLPDSAGEVLAGFDAAKHEGELREWIAGMARRLDPVVLIPTMWNAPAHFSFYFQYGYEAFLGAVGLYPEAVGKMYWESGILANARNRIAARLFKEFDLPPILFCGDDMCNNNGPMVSPDFIRKHYWPHAKLALAPFVDAGIRLVCHCDGNVNPLVDDIIRAGFTGFQGFQYECGVDPYHLRERCRAIAGREPVFMAGLSVTRTLPFGTARDVCDEVDYCLDYTDGGKGLFLFPSNVTGVEVPPASFKAAYDYLKQYDPNTAQAHRAEHTSWPWLRERPDGGV